MGKKVSTDNEWVFPAKLEGLYDGDTFNLELDLGFGLKIYKSVRLVGADTPEIRGGTPETKALARYAKDEAERFILGASTVVFRATVWAGKYGRPIGDMICDGASLSEWLIESKLAVLYDGGSRVEIQVEHQKNAEAAIESNLIQIE